MLAKKPHPARYMGTVRPVPAAADGVSGSGRYQKYPVVFVLHGFGSGMEVNSVYCMELA